MAELTHFYHIWADGEWNIPVREHFTALSASAFPGPVHVGIVGKAIARRHAEERVRTLWPGELIVCAAEATGFEQVTLSRLLEHAKSGCTRYILYAHTKGAYHPELVNDLWRRDLIAHVVDDWRSCVALLDGNDAVGAHWLPTGTVSPDTTVITDGPPFFAGNFWWATSAYLATLAHPDTTSRYAAEGWIGTGGPRVHDLAPGWPVYASAPGRAAVQQ